MPAWAWWTLALGEARETGSRSTRRARRESQRQSVAELGVFSGKQALIKDSKGNETSEISMQPPCICNSVRQGI